MLCRHAYMLSTLDLNSTRPEAKVQPQRRETPSELHYNNTDVIYENVPGMTDGHQCQTTKELTKTYETSENEVNHSVAIKPPRKKKTGQEIVVMGDNSVQQKPNERVSQTRDVTKVKEEMTQDSDNLDEVIDEYDDVDNDDLVYSNEVSNLNFKPADVPLATLQKYLFDHLKGQQLEDEFSVGGFDASLYIALMLTIMSVYMVQYFLSYSQIIVTISNISVIFTNNSH